MNNHYLQLLIKCFVRISVKRSYWGTILFLGSDKSCYCYLVKPQDRCWTSYFKCAASHSFIKVLKTTSSSFILLCVVFKLEENRTRKDSISMKVVIMLMGIDKIFYMTHVLRNSIQRHSSDCTTSTTYFCVALHVYRSSYIITTIVFYLNSCDLNSPIIAYLTNRSVTRHLK